jgi:molybdopterin converting factor small subunit
VSKVKVKYYGLIQNVVDNFESETCVSDDATVRELLESLAKRYGDKFRTMVFTSDQQLAPLTVIHLNGRDINEIGGLNTKVEDNSELSITVFVYIMIGG